MAAHFHLFSLLLTIDLLTSPSLSQQTQFLFPGFKHSPNLTLSGIAQIQSNGLISLTNHTSRLIGRAFYPTPIQFKRFQNDAVSSFSSIFALAIVPEYAKLGGHGLAFVFSPKKDLTDGLPSQFLGILNSTDRGNFSNHLFAIEFDTVQDFEFEDINDNHVGVDLNDLKSNFSVSAGYFIDGISGAQPIKLNSGKTILVWIAYDSAKTQLNVTLSLSSTKPISPILSVNIDLSPIFKEFMYVGFSSSTGLLASSHYLLGWSFKINGEAQPLNLSSLPSFPGRKPKNTSLVIAISISASIFVILSIGIAFYLIKKKMKKSDVIEDWELEVGPHRFSYKELKLATRGFRDEELLGFGGFGKVYRGVLPDSENEIAVKKISNESKQGIKEFVSEIANMGRLRHRNLVQLLGWCRRKTELLLVYEFMPNGSLDKYLFENPFNILSWENRYKIIKGVASGLLYLHEEWEQAVIHRDIKAGNVLLDLEMNGKLGDFGLSKLYEHGSNPNTTKVVGTLGYLAPELTKTGKPSKKSDIFAFGALLLEVVCGRRPIEHRAYPEELILVDWVWDRWRKGAIFEIVDKKLEGEYNGEEVVEVVKIGLMCSNDVAAERPSMRQVVSYLEGEVRLPEVVVPPEGRKGGVGGGGAAEFEDFVHSYPSSSRFEKVSLCSRGDGATEEITDI